MISKVLNFFKKPANSLYGRDLEVWEYLGFTTMSYPNRGLECYVHCFMAKGNDNLRDFHLEGKHAKEFHQHSWMTNIHLWKSLQIHYSSVVCSWPSRYLRVRMENEGFQWDGTNRTWKALTVKTDNVITSKFGK